MSEKPKKPLMRYFGGKWILADWIISHFPPHRIYVEPYGGAASVLLQKDRAPSEVYNDLDSSVYNLFRVMRDDYLKLARKLKYTPFSREEFYAAYEPTDDPVEAARRLLVRSWMGRSGIGQWSNTGFITNTKAEKFIYDAENWVNWVNHACVIAERLQNVTIENRPAIDVITGHDTDQTLFYIDPPYPHETRTGGGYAHEMTSPEHQDLAECLQGVEGMVILSGYACELYDDELYTDWYRVERETFTLSNASRTEVLWINPAAKASLDKARELPPMLALLAEMEENA